MCLGECHIFFLKDTELSEFCDRAFLTFEAVTSALYCFMNGVPVGYSQDSCLPAEFDVTHLLKPGTNSLAVQVLLGIFLVCVTSDL